MVGFESWLCSPAQIRRETDDSLMKGVLEGNDVPQLRSFLSAMPYLVCLNEIKHRYSQLELFKKYWELVRKSDLHSQFDSKDQSWRSRPKKVNHSVKCKQGLRRHVVEVANLRSTECLPASSMLHVMRPSVSITMSMISSHVPVFEDKHSCSFTI